MARMRIYTRKGDAGRTGLLYGGERMSKADPRADACGSVDEAVSALGLSRAAFGALTDRTEAHLSELVVRVQRELFVVGAELATLPERRARLTPERTLVTDAMVSALERDIDALDAGGTMPTEFVLPGQTLSGAAIDVARTTVRRAERRAVALVEAGGLPDDSRVLPYLNRLADLLFVMARTADGGYWAVRG
jgi:cob(I)alamin adenosyltransferase